MDLDEALGLFPGLGPVLAGPRRWEVTLTVPREDGGDPLVPSALPGAVLGCWSASQVTASAVVRAGCAADAVRMVESLVPELARMAGACWSARAG